MQNPSRQVAVDEQIQVVLAVSEAELSLAEATVQLRIWQRGSEYVDSVPSPTSRP